MTNLFAVYGVAITYDMAGCDGLNAGRAAARKAIAAESLSALRAAIKARRDRGLRMTDLPCGRYTEAHERKVGRLAGWLLGAGDELRLGAIAALNDGEIGWAKALVSVADYALQASHALRVGLIRD